MKYWVIETALQWVQRSYADFGNKSGVSYTDVLRHLIAQDYRNGKNR